MEQEATGLGKREATFLLCHPFSAGAGLVARQGGIVLLSLLTLAFRATLCFPGCYLQALNSYPSWIFWFIFIALPPGI